MSILQLNGVCPAILVGLNEVLAEDPTYFNTPVGGIQSLMDPANKRGTTIQQEAYAGDGHQKIVRIMHKQRAIPSDITDEKTCDEGEEKPRFEETFEVQQHKQHVLKIKESTIRNLCSAWSDWVKIPGATSSNPNDRATARMNPAAQGPLMIMREMAEEVIMDLDAFRQEMNTVFLTSVAAHIGAFTGQGGTPAAKTYNIIKSADNSLVLTGFNQFQQDLRKIGVSGRPIVFGGGNMDLALDSMKYGCCNDAGVDFGVMRTSGAPFQFYRDYSDFSTYFTDDNSFIAFLPKAIQFVNYLKYVGSFATQIGTMARGTIMDPVLGIDLDVRVMPNECGEYYNMWINSDFDFYFAPDNIFKSGDRLEAVNGIVEGIGAAI
jgi:hypothetical protein